MATDYGVTALTVPPDCCIPGDCQGIVDLVAQNIQVDRVVETEQIYVGTRPSEHKKPWINIEDGYLYIPDTNQSLWKRPYWISTPSSMQMIWVDSKEKLWAFEGGSGLDPEIAGNTTEFTGSFWKVDHLMDGRSPMGVGNLGGDSTKKFFQVKDIGGSTGIILTAPQLPDHIHELVVSGTHEGTPPQPFGLQPGALWDVVPAPLKTKEGTGGGDPQTTVDVTHPIFAVYFAVRTIRKWFTIPFTG